ncbi:MAG TPA: VWA domain-containing protein [Candidatus Cloacimonadota bacterium]|nr:VWA domain-containing protein [Candidatus Cloacimonadota bacterium]
MLEFVNIKWLWALLILIPYLVYEILVKQKRRVRINYSQIDLVKKVAGSSWLLNYIPIILRVLVITLLIIALARPRMAHKRQQITGKGIDIMLAIDVSGSMQAVDFKPTNRLEAAKKVAEDFIDKRHNDRIGLVVFAENAFTQCPLTLDYNILMNIMDKVQINKDANGTAIGMGLATAVARMKDSEAKSKVIILITDGLNNTGEIDPLTAADLAATYNIKVYPIGVGSKGLVDYPVQTPFGMQYQKVKIDFDMDSLNKIADATGTDQARLATNTAELEAILQNT